MIPPTSIDGTDITGATIDGTDVQEITVDGDVVFTAGATLPVAYSNLIAWYPFDSAEYGGSNADDVTAILGGSGDDTAYDGTVNGPTYQSSGGVTDIRAGANSGGFDFDGSNDVIDNTGTPQLTTPFSITAWAKPDAFAGDSRAIFANWDSTNSDFYVWFRDSGQIEMVDDIRGGVTGSTFSANQFYHVAAVFSNTENILYVDNNVDLQSSGHSQTTYVDAGGITIGSFDKFDGIIDDVRLYNKALSATEVSQIYNNTKP